MARIPLLSGSRVSLFTVDDAVLLAPPPPLDPLRDIAAAVGEALRYPLSGAGLGDLVTRGGRVAIVVEPRSLPLPGAAGDPRQEAVAAVIDELERLGMPAEKHTIVIAGGLERRAGRARARARAPPHAGARFPGSGRRPRRESADLRPLDVQGAAPVRVNGSLLDADLVVCVTAAETSERGGACSLLGACAADAISAPDRPRRCLHRRSPPPGISPARSRQRSLATPP